MNTATDTLVTNSPKTGGGNIEGQSATDKNAFYGATPIVQPTAAANVHTVTAGSTTTVFVNTSFDGTIGSTAYTVGDLVAALKNLGLIAK